MKIELIKKDAAINFADVVPQVKEVMLEAFKLIMTHENAPMAEDDDFEVHHSSSEPTNNFGGTFITSCYGSYLLHDIRVEEVVCDDEDQIECTILFYSLSKISDQ